MARQVDLHRYTDWHVIGKATEFDERIKAENPEFRMAWYRCDITYRNRFILEADAKGISRYEEMLGLIPYGTLEDRRKRVYGEWNRTVLWTERTLRAYLDGLLGKDAYRIELLFNSYALKLSLRLAETDVSSEEVLSNLREIVPANIALNMVWEVNGYIYVAIYRRQHIRMHLWSHSLGDIEEAIPVYVGVALARTHRRVRFGRGSGLPVRAKGYPSVRAKDYGQIIWRR